jgi:hypothetical protein
MSLERVFLEWIESLERGLNANDKDVGGDQ